MLHRCAERLTDVLYRHAPLSPQRKAVYVYGVELALSNSAGFLSIVLLSLLLREPLSALIFLVVFVSLRNFSGGFHAETYRSCFLITNTTYLASFLLSRGLVFCGSAVPSAGILLLSCVFIWIWAPIRNKHHPLSAGAIVRNRRISRCLTAAEAASAVLAFAYGRNLSLFSCFVSSVAAVAVMMGIAKLKERRNQND